MQTPRQTVEFTLEEWKLDEKGFTTAPFIARFELIWPRPLIDSRKSVLPLPDTFGELMDWSEDPLKKKLFFKEQIEGSFVLNTAVHTLTEEGGEELPQEARDLIGRAYARESSITWRTLSDLLELGESVASYILSGPQKSVAVGSMDVIEQTNRLLEIPLTTPTMLRNPHPDQTPEDNQPRDDHREILKDAGESNGYLKVKMNVWDE